MNEKNGSIFDDEVMKELFAPYARERLAEFERLNRSEHRYSRGFERKRKRLMRLAARPVMPVCSARRAMRAAVCIAVMIAVLTVSVGAAQGWFARMELLERGDTSFTSRVVTSFKASDEIRASVPTKLPEGFKPVWEDSGREDEYYSRQYANGDHSLITFIRFKNNPDSTLMHHYALHEWEDFEISGISEIQIGDYRGKLIATRWGGTEDMEIEWSDGKYTYQVFTTTGHYGDNYVWHPEPNTLDDLVLIAESVR